MSGEREREEEEQWMNQAAIFVPSARQRVAFVRFRSLFDASS